MSGSELKFRSRVAMRITGNDLQHFNETVAAGHYPCSPPTSGGSVRMFDEKYDLPTLYVFGRLRALGVPPRKAGHLACEFRDHLRDPSNQKSDRIVFVQGEYDSIFIGSERFEPQVQYGGIGRTVLTIEFYVNQISDLIAERIEKEQAAPRSQGVDN